MEQIRAPDESLNITAKEWNRILDKYLTINKLLSSEYESLNEVQKTIIQELKKAFKRIENNKYK